MPRGVRRTADEQIAFIDRQIQELTEKRKLIIESKEQDAIDELLRAAKAAGKSPTELVNELSK